MALVESPVTAAMAAGPKRVPPGRYDSDALTKLAAVGERARPVALSREQVLEVAEPLRPLLPQGGLRRGSSVAVEGSTALALALAAGPSAAGSWVAAVGVAGLGAVAAAEVGVDLGRFALVPVVPREQWAVVVAALLDALDVVVVGAPPGVRAADARRLAARARERRSVLVIVGRGWPEATDVRLAAGESRWEGLGRGHGCLRARRLEVVAGGRGAAARERRAWLWLPSPDGGVAVAAPPGERSRGTSHRAADPVALSS